MRISYPRCFWILLFAGICYALFGILEHSGCVKFKKEHKRVVVVAAVCSVGIEVMQGVRRIGYAEVDDVLNNVTGTAIGAMGYWLGAKIRKNVSDKSHFKS